MSQEVSKLRPVIKEVMVRCPLAEAFRIFTEGFGTWWPAHQYSVSQQRVKLCGMETWVAGDLFEVRDDGRRFVWGTIQVWNPPTGVAFTWHPGRDQETAQVVEVTFDPVSGGTHVRLEHRNWERLGKLAEKTRTGYQGGWEHVFCDCFVKAAGGELPAEQGSK